jgi:hypothetical protein
VSAVFFWDLQTPGGGGIKSKRSSKPFGSVAEQ